MGWGRTFLLGDIGNRLDIADTEREISEVKNAMKSAYHLDMSQEEQLEKLILENGELRLYVASLFRLLLEKNLISKLEIEKMVNNIDGTDGERDGAHKGPII